MSSKIFKAIWITAISVFLASLILIMGALYNYFSSVQKKQLRIETELAAHGVSQTGIDYLEGLDAEDYRITWISSDGNVLFDNEADISTMENHLEREEIKEAMENGFGESTRHSYTLADQQYYAAEKLPDGSVLRMSIVQLSVWALVLGFAQPVCIVIVIALVLSFILASRLTKKIVKPINDIEIDHPENYLGNDSYKEVEPLLRHISAQKMQLKRDQKQIEKTALIRQEFTANASHELKTPLHVISGYAELIRNGMAKEEDIGPFAEKIHDESLRMTKLVEDIIELTRLDSSSEDWKFEECDMMRIAENAVDSLDAAASEMDVTVTAEGDTAPMIAVPQLIYSIVYNLCDNAIKYNHKGGSVKISVTQKSGMTVLRVKDTGIGIPEESRDRIFERFYRVDKSHSKEVGGTGLGLSIMKHAVKIHNGSIEFSSTPGEGSEFIVILPNKPER